MNQTRAGPFQKRGEWVSFPVMKAATYYAVLLALVLGVGCGDGKERDTWIAEKLLEEYYIRLADEWLLLPKHRRSNSEGEEE